MILKCVFRNIRKSLGRYLAILSIIALGVGFFAGLRVTERSMMKTADNYINEYNLYDLRLISTLGFIEDDVEAFRSLSGIENACGSVSADLIYVSPSGSDSVLHAHSLITGMNGMDIVSGRLPEASNECVLDAKYADDSRLGSKIVLSENNSDKTKADFVHEEYTVVGLVNAVTYINFERGSTSLGGGSVSGFIFIPREGFNIDYYTEIYLTLPHSGEIYSDVYKASVDAVRDSVSALLEERAQIRYDKICSEARDEIGNAQTELDGKVQYILDIQTQIDEGWEEYRTKKAAAEAELEGREVLLETSRSELDAAWKALEELKNSPSASEPEVAEQINATEAELNIKESSYLSAVSEYEGYVSELTVKLTQAENLLNSIQDRVNSASEEVKSAQAEIDSARTELERLQPATVYTLDRSSNIGYACLENDTAIVSGVARVFPLFFFLVAALVCITTVTRMVSEQRTENGVLKALGYGSGAIAGQYLIYAGSASVIGCILGFLLGSKLMPMALWQVYRIMYSIDRPVEFVLDWQLFAVCSVLYLICALGIAWLVCYRDLRENAAQLIRPKAPSAGKRTLIERMTFFWKHLSFLHKITVRNIMRYKKRMFMMIVGIGGCTALLLTGFGISDTIKPVVDSQYREISLYDAAVSFLHDAGDAERSAFSDAVADFSDDVAYVYSGSADLTGEDGTDKINLVVFGSDIERAVNIHNGEKPLEWPSEGEAVVNYRFAKENGVSVGDTVDLMLDDYRSLTVTVVGIFDNYIYDYIYVNEETCVSQWGSAPMSNTAYLSFRDGTDAHSASAQLLGTENVASVTLSEDMRTRVGSMLDSMDYIVLIVLVCAGALSFIVLYNLTNITITERTREIATLKVLGFYQGEQNSYVFRENLVLTGISAVCGIPLGIALLHYVMNQVKISTIYFGCRLDWKSYIFAVLLTFVFTLLVDIALTAKTRRINMAEALKAIE